MDKLTNETQDYFILQLSSIEFTREKYKTPFLYETWVWEGDESVLPYKWVDLIKNSKVIPVNSEADFQNVKEYLRQNYYGNNNFDKQSFFFITSRSEVAGCAYLNKENSTVEYYIINPKYVNKGVEEGLFALIYQRALVLNKDTIKFDLTKTNIQQSFFESLN